MWARGFTVIALSDWSQQLLHVTLTVILVCVFVHCLLSYSEIRMVLNRRPIIPALFIAFLTLPIEYRCRNILNGEYLIVLFCWLHFPSEFEIEHFFHRKRWGQQYHWLLSCPGTGSSVKGELPVYLLRSWIGWTELWRRVGCMFTSNKNGENVFSDLVAWPSSTSTSTCFHRWVKNFVTRVTKL